MNEIDTSEYTEYSLEELREMQKGFLKKRNRSEAPTITGLNPEYAKRVFGKKSPKTVDELIMGLESGKRKPHSPLMDYGEARRAFWNIYKSEIEKRKGTPKMTAELKEFLPHFIKWFIRDGSCKYDLDRGFLLIGKTGTGKTLLFDCMKIMTRELELETDFLRADCLDILHECRNDVAKMNGYKLSSYFFDDLGAEENEVMSYGNVTNVMGFILDRRYKRHESHGTVTHISTNLDDDEIIERYGERVYDRMRKMFEFVFVGNKSFRR